MSWRRAVSPAGAKEPACADGAASVVMIVSASSWRMLGDRRLILSSWRAVLALLLGLDGSRIEGGSPVRTGSYSALMGVGWGFSVMGFLLEVE